MTADGSTSDGKLRNNLPFLPRHASPAGGAYTTAEDLLGFVRAVESGRLVRRDTRQLMMARHGERNRPPFRYQGLGVCLDSIEGHLVWGHGGAMAGANCIVQVCPDLDRTLIVLSNADPPVAYNLAARLLPKAVPQSS
jgi:CubicO group peptidase (beta-lactamase class C family)